MPNNPDDVLINFIGDTSGLQPVENVMEQIITQAGEVGTAWEKASTAMNSRTKATVEVSNKLVKGIQDLAVAAKSMDKAVIGGAYSKYLKDIQQQLGLTNKEVIAFVQNARKAAQQQIFSAQTDQEVDEITLSIEAMNEQLKLLGAAEDETSGKTQSLRARIREAKEELIAMAEAGLGGTPAFNELQQKAGELDDQMKDLNATISNVGSDTKNIDGLISLAGGLAGGFAIAQGSAALFGAGEEEIQKALLKVNAAMAILQGLQQIQNVLQRENAAMLLISGLRTRALAVEQKLLTFFTLESAAAATALRAALIATGIGAIIALLAVAANAMGAFGDSTDDTTESLQEQADAAKDLVSSLEDIIAASNKVRQANAGGVDVLKRELDLMKARGASNVEIYSKEQELRTKELSDLRIAAESYVNLFNTRKKNGQLTVALEQEINEKIAAINKEGLDKQTEIDAARLANQLENAEKSFKSASGFADAEVAKRKLAIIQNQVDSIASIKAVSDAEINAINKRRKEELAANNGLTPGERAKINADADLAIAENKKNLSQELLKVETAGIESKILLAKEGSDEEYNAKFLLLEKEKATALNNNQVTADDKLRIEADFVVKKRDLDRAYNEQKLQNEISYFNTYIDEFGITEDRKLELTLRRLDMQRDLEISQAKGNAAKIKEINAKYDLETRETKKAAIVAELQDRLNVMEVYNTMEQAANERILSVEISTFDQRKKASLDILAFQLNRLDLEEQAETRKLDQGLILQKDYDVAIQNINNKRSAATIKSEEEITAAIIREIEKRTSVIQGVFNILQKGLSATMDTSGLTVAITELQNFGVMAQDIFARIKAGTIDTTKGIQAIASAAIGVAQSTINQIFADNAAARQQTLSDDIALLEDQKAKEVDNENLTQQQKADIDKKYKDKEKQLRIRAFEAEKEAKKEQAIINGALAITNILATVPKFDFGVMTAILIGAAIASTALQVNAINRAKTPKFRHGKVNIEGPGTATSDSIPAMISRGESVINAEATSKWKDALQAINSNKFEHYMMNKMSDFVFPQIPEGFQPVMQAQEIDYNRLAREIAKEMKGIIPASKQIDFSISENGITTIVREGNSRTEYKNKRYSMT